MLKRVDPTNLILMTYLALINPNDETGVLLAKPNEDSSNKSQGTKKDDKSTTKHIVQLSKTTTKPVETTIVDTHTETIPLNFGVLKRIKKKAHPSRKSPERSSSFSPFFTRKPHVTQKGVIIHEVQALVSPTSKKRRATDMDKHISKKIKKRKLTPVIPPEVSLTKSFHEEVRASGILTHISDTDVNVTMGERDSNKEHPMITHDIINTITINTLFYLPPFIIPIIPVSSSPTFTHILNKPLTSLFSSQSTNPLKSIDDTETDDGGFGGTFDDLEFDQKKKTS
ncbi:unnamed protein product [Lactuca saligna]|uniref:Uncharacterized protein n=1 Tax=Lactuca saligna TaxID=75948 RepID=A0AA35Z0A6_LACSI|nr:unnamed protein product [Lactuca saligna]